MEAGWDRLRGAADSALSAAASLPPYASALLGAAAALLLALALWRAFARRRDFFDLADRTVFITGGSSGIGLACAASCLAAGANVAPSAAGVELPDGARSAGEAAPEAAGEAVAAVWVRLL